MVSKRNFLSVAEKRRFEKFATDSAVNQARRAGGNDLADAIEGLIEKGLVIAVRMESGEYQFKTTQLGQIVMSTINESDLIDFNNEEEKEIK